MGNLRGGGCENFADYESLQGKILYPFRVEFSEDLTFELTEEELTQQPTEEAGYKINGMLLLQNFYVRFGENSEEILYQDYVEFSEKFSEIMLDPKPEYFPLKFRIDYASYKYVEGDDYQVEAIGDYAFFYCSSLTSITIPEGVTSIGEGAFNGCSSLTSITIPEGVREIGRQAFYYCDRLTSITLPSSLEVFGSATSDDFPKNLQNQNFYTEPTTGDIYFGNSTNNYLILIEVADKTITDFDFPEGCKIVLESAFLECTELTSIEIPEGITQISGFTNCSNLASVSLPSTLISIGEAAFDGCSSLTTISIPEGVTSIYDSAFSGCSSLTTISIPEGVTEISNFAFSGCSGLTSITIPEGVTKIGRAAFAGCSSLTSITIPEGVTKIDQEAFQRCSSLTSVSLPSTLTSISKRAFDSCYALAIVYNNSNLNITAGSFDNGNVGNYAVEIVTSENPQVGEIVVEGNVQYYVNEETGKKIALAPSVPRDSLTSVTIRKGTIEIGSSAFEGCSSLAEISINGNISTLDQFVFSGCSNLTKLTLGANVTTLSSNLFAFGNLTDLTTIVVEEGSSLSAALPTYGTWVKDAGSETVTNFSGAGTYTRTDV